MVTYSQLNRRVVTRQKKRHTNKVAALRGNPQKRGFVLKVFTEKPKKPNSAKRKVVRVKLCTQKEVRVQVPGEGHTLAKFSKIMIRGGHTRDLPGIRYRIIRGKLDCLPVLVRRKARSKYGLKKRDLLSPERIQEIKDKLKSKKKK